MRSLSARSKLLSLPRTRWFNRLITTKGRWIMDIRQKASITAISLALVLAISKFIIGFASNSMTVVSSGLDSLLDVFMSTMNLFAIWKASQPADDSHQYGHGKVEDMAQVVQAVVIVTSGTLIIYRSVHEYLHDEIIVYSMLDAGVMLLSLAFTFIIMTTLKRIGEKTNSNTLRADALHYTSDIYSNSSALIAMALTFYTGRAFFDLLFAVITGCIIIYSAIRILKSGLYGLMDASHTRESSKRDRRDHRPPSLPVCGIPQAQDKVFRE